MTVQGRILERILKLPPAVTRKVEVTKDLQIPARDGVELLADLHAPQGLQDAPTMLVRTPYGRDGVLSRLISRAMAERGYKVLIAAARGTNGSGGTFDPLVAERADGLATLDWLEKQPWHNGKVVLFGASYLGYVQFAMAPQDWLVNTEPDGAYWTERGHRDRVGEITAPVLLFSGWQDFILPGVLDDYAAMRAAGRDPYLTVGPWLHADFKQAAVAFTEAHAWFQAHLNGDRGNLRELPVRLYVEGAGEWRDYPSYPPPGVVNQTCHLRSGGGLSPELAGGPDPAQDTIGRYRYDPANPTPDFGGPLLDPRTGGREDQASREDRPDVLVCTGDALVQPLEVIGPVSADIKLRTSTGHADLFVRLCDVDEQARSVNVCDGIQRITPEEFPAGDDGVRTVPVTLSATAYRFKPGHRLRVQVCGGSFPRFARNTGTGQPLATATGLVPIDYEILPGSAITISVL
jgi:predicted acyl esterase